MITFALALLVAAQAAEPPPTLDNTPSPWPERDRGFGPGIERVKSSEGEARATMARFAACVADSSTSKVAEVLTRDFRTTDYRNGLKNLARANEGCAKQVGMRSETLRSSNLPFAAALAEAMMARDAAPLNVRIAKAAIGKEAATFAPSDKIAMCVVRSTPDDVAALFATDPGTDTEDKAAAALGQVVGLCGQGIKLESSVVGLRSILATASFRLLAAQAG